ncbi:MAG: alginate export family protein [Bacteroidales bacterium]
MKHLVKQSLLVVLFICSTMGLKAQFSIHADLSPRAELRHGYRQLPKEDEKAAINVNQRTRLAFGYQHESLRMHISFQEVRVWGQEVQRQHNANVAVHEAWGELLFNPNLSLKVGRQHLRYDNQRFFAINDWIPMGQKHDVALLKAKLPSGELHFATAFNQPASAFQNNFGTLYSINNYKYMNFAWFNTSLSENTKLSLLAAADGFEGENNPNTLYVRGTWSAYLTSKLGGVDLMVNPAVQHGKTRGARDIAAWYFRTDASLSLMENSTSTLGLEIFSGNDPQDGSKYRAFDALYGAGHLNNGFMDYFTLIPQHTRQAGLVNPFIKNNFKVTQKTSLDADLHLFFIQNDFFQGPDKISKYLGTEIDLTLNYRFNDFTRIIGGFSWMFASESMEVINRGADSGSHKEPAYFAYIMLRIRPKLL